MENPAIYLASRSPRRQELLGQIGVCYTLLDVEIDESVRPNENPDDFGIRMAMEKAEAGAAQLQQQDKPILAADTSVIVDNRILGKPDNEEDAIEMLTMLSARSHRVLTAVALTSSETSYRLSESQVQFRPIDIGEIRSYWESGEPADKAGAYGIQGLGAIFVERISGSYSGVMGLPLFETAELLRNAGIRVLQD